MGRSEYHRRCRQLGVGQDVGGHGNHQVFKSALGGDSCNGTEHYYQKDDKEKETRSWHLTLRDRIRSTRAWVLTTTRERIATSMILIARMLWILMHWCKLWRIWSKGIVHYSQEQSNIEWKLTGTWNEKEEGRYPGLFVCRAPTPTSDHHTLFAPSIDFGRYLSTSSADRGSFRCQGILLLLR